MSSSPVRLLLLVLTAQLLLAVSTQQLPAAVESESARQSQQATIDRLEARIRLLETKTVQAEAATTIDLLEARARHQAEQHEAKIRLLETKNEQLQEAVLHLQTKTTRLEDALHNKNNDVTMPSSWSPAPPAPPERRGLATCNASAGARLLVEGVCSCTEDVVVGGRSVVDQLDQFNASLHALETRVEQATGSVSLVSGGSEAANCAHRLGALLGLEPKGALKDSSNMDFAFSVALDVDAGLAYVAAANSDGLAIVDVGTDPSNPSLVGVLKDSSNMDEARSVALDVDAGLAYVAAYTSDSLAIVDVGTDPSNPTLVGVLKDSTNMDNARSVALDVDAGLAYVAAEYSDSLAIVDVKAVTWCAHDFSVSANRRNITSWF